MKKVGIYKITNPKGKVYIGQSIDIIKRWNVYRYLIRSSMGNKIFNSLKKYGPDNHTFEILEECTKDQLSVREVYYKTKYNSIADGLNLKLEDDRYGPHSQETKDLISKKCKEAAKKKVYTAEFRLKMKKAKTNHPCYKNPERNRKIGNAHRGKVMSQETKDKIYTEDWRRKNKEQHKKSYKPVEQYDLNGNLIKVYESKTEAIKQTGIGMGNALVGRAKTAGGFIWKYKNKES